MKQITFNKIVIFVTLISYKQQFNLNKTTKKIKILSFVNQNVQNFLRKFFIFIFYFGNSLISK